MSFFGKLLPREGNFFELFDRHAGFIAEGSQAFSLLVQNYSDPVLRERYSQDVISAERAADRVTAEINMLLHRTFITPFDREQIHSLINSMDDILDLLQDCTETMSLYDLRELTDEVLSLAELCGRCCERVQKAVALLPHLSHADAAARAVAACEEIDQLESDADRVMRAAMSRLFRSDIEVRELIKLKTVYEQLESVTDRCENVANLIEGVVLENA